VLTDHDSRVLARRRVRAKTWRLGPVLAWARQQAHKHGFADVTVGCEPTGHRWRVLDQLAAQQGMALVCVQPLLVGRAREPEDYTRDKSDDKDAVLIARLVAQLRCYAPERADATWSRLRHLGARRDRLTTEATLIGRSRISRRGRPRLRMAAWRALWAALPNNAVLARRFQHLTTRAHDPLTRGQARAALAGALLRWLHVITTQRVPWDSTRAGAGQLPVAA
jgi:hypothetical protein